MRTRLSTLATVLHNTVRIIDSEPVLSPEEEAAHQATQFAEFIAAANAERRALSLHKALIPNSSQNSACAKKRKNWAGSREPRS